MITSMTPERLAEIDREFVAKGHTLDGGWDWANDHGPDLIVEVGGLQNSLRAIHRLARSDGQRTFDETIWALGQIDALCRGVLK